jgi:hypothetical protein
MSRDYDTRAVPDSECLGLRMFHVQFVIAAFQFISPLLILWESIRKGFPPFFCKLRLLSRSNTLSSVLSCHFYQIRLSPRQARGDVVKGKPSASSGQASAAGQKRFASCALDYSESATVYHPVRDPVNITPYQNRFSTGYHI